MIKVTRDRDDFLLSVPYAHNWMAKSAPDRTWDKAKKVWRVPGTKPCAVYVRDTFPNAMDMDVKHFIEDILAEKPSDEKFPDREFPVPPMEHQVSAMDAAWGNRGFALFHEMGLGKTFAAIAIIDEYIKNQKTRQALVICPTSIKTVWAEEVAKYAPHLEVYIHKAGQKPDYNCHMMVVGVESLSQGRAFDYAMHFIESGTTACILDEASKIKNFKATRTERVVEIGSMCSHRIALTGTPVTQGIQDMYTQFKFLDPRIIGLKSYYSFRNRYCTMGGFENKQIVGYTNVGELMLNISPYIHTARKEDCLDLPDKVFEKRWIDPSAEQVKAYRELKAGFIGDLSVENTLDMLTRLQQVASGLYPYKIGEDEKTGAPVYAVERMSVNPKLKELEDLIDELPDDSGTIIWARFREEITMVADMLRAKGKSVVEYHGGVKEDNRQIARHEFQSGQVQFFVANQATGGMGLTLTAGTTVIYLSNTFSYEERVQSEDRAHRKGQTNKVTYIDLFLKYPSDRLIDQALQRKTGIAEYVRDNIKTVHGELL